MEQHPPQQPRHRRRTRLIWCGLCVLVLVGLWAAYSLHARAVWRNNLMVDPDTLPGLIEMHGADKPVGGQHVR